MDIVNDISSLTSFKRETARCLKRLKKTGDPMVLTVNGKAEVVVQDARAYQRMLDLINRAEAVEAIRLGLEEMRQGKGVDAVEALNGLREKHGIGHGK